jgi:hypothetical protein
MRPLVLPNAFASCDPPCESRRWICDPARPLVLHQGQIGTVVMIYPDGHAKSNLPGRAYALLPIQPEKLIMLYDSADYAAA